MQPADNTDDLFEPPASPPYKLDLRYFTSAELCPRMVRQRSRRSFELFMFIAHRCLKAWGEPFAPTHAELCDACGLDPHQGDSRSAVAHTLRRLADLYQVIDYEPLRRQRPRVRLRPIDPEGDLLQPRHYVRCAEPWNGQRRALFDQLGRRTLAAEFMYQVARYEAALARVKHERDYWFFPLERIAQTFHVSPRVAGAGLQALVELGVMHVSYGRRDMAPPGAVFGRSNRYFFIDFEGLEQRQRRLEKIRVKYADIYEVAYTLAAELTNGRTAANVAGLCELIRTAGQPAVAAAVERVTRCRTGSPRRRLAYIRAIVGDDSATPEAPP